MRTSDDRLQCTKCLTLIGVTIRAPMWCQKAQTYVEKIAAAEGWDLENRRCPACKEKA